MAEIAVLERPKRWDVPFDSDMTNADIDMVMARPEVTAIDHDRFPTHIPLKGIVLNDMRVVRFPARAIIVREGDYGNSAFLLLEGMIRSDMSGAIADKFLGRLTQRKKGLIRLLKELLFPNTIPEFRNVRRYSALKEGQVVGQKGENFTLINAKEFERLKNETGDDSKEKLVRSAQGTLFGEAAAIGRVPHNITHIAETDVVLLEIKWQGLRDICKFDEGWRISTQESYHRKALLTHLRECELFANLDDNTLKFVAENTVFETLGSYDWHISYKKEKAKGAKEKELPLSNIGDHPDGLVLIVSGMARVSAKLGNGLRTITYLRAGEYHGLNELHEGWQEQKIIPLRTALTVLGYVHILRVPTHVVEKVLFPLAKGKAKEFDIRNEGAFIEDALLEWAVEQRYINGTKTMLIDLDRCVRCDDCVRACGASHDGNPRFVRHGRVHDHWMVANACQHCSDPVCMIGCPTGAIHRNQQAGVVVINDDTCIGCGACVSACPYENIRKVEINDRKGNRVLDPASHQPIEKATKCDFCYEHPGGPNCVKACPHGALSRVDFQSRFGSQSKGASKTIQSKNTPLQNFSLWFLAVFTFIYLAYWVWSSTLNLEVLKATEVTGYTLLSAMGFLAMLKLRKRMAVVSIIRVAWWKYAHVVIGFFVIGVFFLHTGTVWPVGVYEQILTGLFYGVVLTGIWGVFIQKVYPAQLNMSETEVIFERIPDELSDIRNEAETVIKECTAETGSETVARFYLETIGWFFRKPRFMQSHLFWGKGKSGHWIEHRCENVRRYLSDAELVYLEKLKGLAELKAKIDYHYYAQGLLKIWLMFHVPIAAAAILVGIWHLLVVNVLIL